MTRQTHNKFKSASTEFLYQSLAYPLELHEHCLSLPSTQNFHKKTLSWPKAARDLIKNHQAKIVVFLVFLDLSFNKHLCPCYMLGFMLGVEEMKRSLCYKAEQHKRGGLEECDIEGDISNLLVLGSGVGQLRKVSSEQVEK